jgi:apolipoprotein N-acyltransferase
MKRLELILFRFACLAAGCGFLYCVVAIFWNSDSVGKMAAAVLAIAGPAAVMAIFYALRWALTGRLKPWVPN